MKRIALGNSSEVIPVIGQGTMGIGGYFERDESRDEEFIRLLRMGLDEGMTLIDTAEIYGAGHSEELVGKAVQGRRQDALIATKFSPEHSSYEAVLQAAENSLRRLKTDVIDLYQTHWPNPETPFEETLRALKKLLDDGKARFVGLSNPTLKQIAMTQSAIPKEKFVSIQQQYNFADRLVEQSTLPVCRKENLCFLAYSPLVEGKIAPEDERKQTLENMAARYSASLAQIALAWLIAQPNVVAIPKAGREEHVCANSAAGNISLSAEDVQTLDELYRPRILELEPSQVEVADAENRNVYKTIEEALENKNNMTPSPRALADDFLQGEVMKPIKVKPHTKQPGRYQLTEGRLRYWAWVIAHEGRKPVPAVAV